jgi:hypothetical protein
MTLDDARAALARDGIPIVRESAALKDVEASQALREAPLAFVTFAHEGREGTLYVDGHDGMNQVLLFGPAASSNGAARAVLARLRGERGRRPEIDTRDEHRWWNATMALEVVVRSKEGRWHVGEHYVPDARPERAGVSPQFEGVNGWERFSWGARPEEVEGWLREQGIAWRRRSGSDDPGPNAPPQDDTPLPNLDFRKGEAHVGMSFGQRRGLLQVEVSETDRTIAEAEALIAERVRRYGPATTVERATIQRWRAQRVKVELSITHDEKKDTWRYAEAYAFER